MNQPQNVPLARRAWGSIFVQAALRLALIAAALYALLLVVSWSRTRTFQVDENLAYVGHEIGAIFDYQLNKVRKHSLDQDWIGLFTSASFLITGSILFLGLLGEVPLLARRHSSWRKGWKESALNRMLFERSDSTRTDLYMFFYHQLSLDGIVVSLLGLFGPIFIYAFLVNHFNLGWGASMPPIVALLLFVVIDDFIAYWYHRFAHVVRPFWELHKFHHSCTEMNIITTHRDHPFEKAISMSLVAIPIVLIGPPAEVYLVFVVIRSLLNVYHHSNFDWTYGWLGYIFMSPRGHRLHHSMKDCHIDLNYGSFLSIWDQMFGTWYRGKDYEILLGATDNYMNQRSFFYDIWSPFPRFWNALLVPARTATPPKPPQSEQSGATPAPGPSGPEAPSPAPASAPKPAADRT